MAEKVYVGVAVMWDADGSVTPTTLFWTDGTPYTIDEVLDVRNAASTRAGGFGVRYKVRISNDEQGVFNKVRFLYYEKGLKPEKWFVEGKERQDVRTV